eukprot:CAMPEP_0196151512 /NCGR_PEP_ID=MMETSP0910-20130528/33803_1 /TAXON_ID=49265 /ORGANISM="Thalassiosira rotula, Strain GSO102" /LENGTH=47 /DNA_ID= /DNA_START= /DNA_END= /DNA_ORIENTATION=
MAAKYAKICELRSSPPVTLEYDAITGRLSLVKDEDDDGRGGARARDD